MKEEQFYWFETRSGQMPKDFITSVQFRWFGMLRDAEGKEVDKMKLVFLMYGTYNDFNSHLEKEGQAIKYVQTY